MDQFDLIWDLCDKLNPRKAKTPSGRTRFSSYKVCDHIRCNKIDFEMIVAHRSRFWTPSESFFIPWATEFPYLHTLFLLAVRHDLRWSTGKPTSNHLNKHAGLVVYMALKQNHDWQYASSVTTGTLKQVRNGWAVERLTLNWIAKTPRYHRLLCRGINRPPWSDSVVNCAAMPPPIRCK